MATSGRGGTEIVSEIVLVGFDRIAELKVSSLPESYSAFRQLVRNKFKLGGGKQSGEAPGERSEEGAGGSFMVTDTDRREIDEAAYQQLRSGDRWRDDTSASSKFMVLSDRDAELRGSLQEEISFEPHHEALVGAGKAHFNNVSHAVGEFVDNSIQATRHNENGNKKIRVMLNFAAPSSGADSHMVIWDNGKGMDVKGVKQFATYFLSQKARGLGPSEEELLGAGSGYIGKFGVGAIQAGFFIGDEMRVTTKVKDSVDVRTFSMSEKKFNERAAKNQAVYKDALQTRRAGEVEGRELEGGMFALLATLEKQTESFTYITLTLREERLNDIRTNKGRALKAGLCHIYHYYLHPRDFPGCRDKIDKQRRAGTSSQGGEGGGGGSTFLPLTNKERWDISFQMFGPKVGAGSTLNVAEEELSLNTGGLESLYLSRQKESFKFDMEVVDPVWLAKHPSVPRAECTGRDRLTVTGVLYFYPFDGSHETRPSPVLAIGRDDAIEIYDSEDEEEEAAQNASAEPVFEVFWMRRLVPHSSALSLSFFPKRARAKTLSALGTNWRGRIKGMLFFDWNYPISNNKLKLSVPMPEGDLQVALNATDYVRYRNRGITAQFKSWLEKCHKELDKEVRFHGALTGESAKDCPKDEQGRWWGKVSFGESSSDNLTFSRDDKVQLRKPAPKRKAGSSKPKDQKEQVILGQIVRFLSDERDRGGGGRGEEMYGDGHVVYLRMPAEVFGEGCTETLPLAYLTKGARPSAQAWKAQMDECLKVMPDKLQMECVAKNHKGRPMPEKLLMTAGQVGDTEDEWLRFVVTVLDRTGKSITSLPTGLERGGGSKGKIAVRRRFLRRLDKKEKGKKAAYEPFGEPEDNEAPLAGKIYQFWHKGDFPKGTYKMQLLVLLRDGGSGGWKELDKPCVERRIVVLPGEAEKMVFEREDTCVSLGQLSLLPEMKLTFTDRGDEPVLLTDLRKVTVACDSPKGLFKVQYKGAETNVDAFCPEPNLLDDAKFVIFEEGDFQATGLKKVIIPQEGASGSQPAMLDVSFSITAVLKSGREFRDTFVCGFVAGPPCSFQVIDETASSEDRQLDNQLLVLQNRTLRDLRLGVYDFCGNRTPRLEDETWTVRLGLPSVSTYIEQSGEELEAFREGKAQDGALQLQSVEKEFAPRCGLFGKVEEQVEPTGVVTFTGFGVVMDLVMQQKGEGEGMAVEGQPINTTLQVELVRTKMKGNEMVPLTEEEGGGLSGAIRLSVTPCKEAIDVMLFKDGRDWPVETEDHIHEAGSEVTGLTLHAEDQLHRRVDMLTEAVPMLGTVTTTWEEGWSWSGPAKAKGKAKGKANASSGLTSEGAIELPLISFPTDLTEPKLYSAYANENEGGPEQETLSQPEPLTTPTMWIQIDAERIRPLLLPWDSTPLNDFCGFRLEAAPADHWALSSNSSSSRQAVAEMSGGGGGSSQGGGTSKKKKKKHKKRGRDALAGQEVELSPSELTRLRMATLSPEAAATILLDVEATDEQVGDELQRQLEGEIVLADEYGNTTQKGTNWEQRKTFVRVEGLPGVSSECPPGGLVRQEGRFWAIPAGLKITGPPSAAEGWLVIGSEPVGAAEEEELPPLRVRLRWRTGKPVRLLLRCPLLSVDEWVASAQVRLPAGARVSGLQVMAVDSAGRAAFVDESPGGGLSVGVQHPGGAGSSKGGKNSGVGAEAGAVSLTNGGQQEVAFKPFTVLQGLDGGKGGGSGSKKSSTLTLTYSVAATPPPGGGSSSSGSSSKGRGDKEALPAPAQLVCTLLQTNRVTFLHLRMLYTLGDDSKATDGVSNAEAVDADVRALVSGELSLQDSRCLAHLDVAETPVDQRLPALVIYAETADGQIRVPPLGDLQLELTPPGSGGGGGGGGGVSLEDLYEFVGQGGEGSEEGGGLQTAVLLRPKLRPQEGQEMATGKYSFQCSYTERRRHITNPSGEGDTQEDNVVVVRARSFALKVVAGLPKSLVCTSGKFGDKYPMSASNRPGDVSEAAKQRLLAPGKIKFGTVDKFGNACPANALKGRLCAKVTRLTPAGGEEAEAPAGEKLPRLPRLAGSDAEGVLESRALTFENLGLAAGEGDADGEYGLVIYSHDSGERHLRMQQPFRFYTDQARIQRQRQIQDKLEPLVALKDRVERKQRAAETEKQAAVNAFRQRVSKSSFPAQFRRALDIQNLPLSKQICDGWLGERRKELEEATRKEEGRQQRQRQEAEERAAQQGSGSGGGGARPAKVNRPLTPDEMHTIDPIGGGMLVELGFVDDPHLAGILSWTASSRIRMVFCKTLEQFNSALRFKLKAAWEQNIRTHKPRPGDVPGKLGLEPLVGVKGFRGFAVNLIQLREEHEHLRATLFYAVYGNTCVFDTLDDASKAMAARRKSNKIVYTAVCLDGKRLDASGIAGGEDVYNASRVLNVYGALPRDEHPAAASGSAGARGGASSASVAASRELQELQQKVRSLEELSPIFEAYDAAVSKAEEAGSSTLVIPSPGEEEGGAGTEVTMAQLDQQIRELQAAGDDVAQGGAGTGGGAASASSCSASKSRARQRGDGDSGGGGGQRKRAKR